MTAMTQTKQELILTLCGQIGFDHFAPLAASALVPQSEVRAMCETDRCGRYGKSWACPPACGSLAHLSDRMGRYALCAVVQTTGKLTDSFDTEGIRAAEHQHKQRFDTLVRQVRRLSVPCLPLGVGSCTRCRACTYPDTPCRYPDRLYPSMEACGLAVRTVCESAGLQYLYGPDTITFTSCILFEEEAAL